MCVCKHRIIKNKIRTNNIIQIINKKKIKKIYKKVCVCVNALSLIQKILGEGFFILFSVSEKTLMFVMLNVDVFNNNNNNDDNNDHMLNTGIVE